MTAQQREIDPKQYAAEVRKRVKPCECKRCVDEEKLDMVKRLTDNWHKAVDGGILNRPPVGQTSAPLTGRVQHFKSEEAKQSHLKYVEDNKATLPF